MTIKVPVFRPGVPSIGGFLLLPVYLALLAAGLQSNKSHCRAVPDEVQVGETSTIVCTCSSVTSWTASGGSISAAGVTATLDTTGVPGNTVMVTASCAGIAQPQQIMVVVGAPMAAAPAAYPLCSISFAKNKKQAASVSANAKACLDDIVTRLAGRSDLKLVVVGLDPSPGQHGVSLAQQRAINTKNYLVQDEGISADRIQVWYGAGDERQVQMFAVPQGSKFDGKDQNLAPVNPVQPKASAKPQ